MTGSTLFLFVTGAGRSIVAPALIERLATRGYRVHTVLTPNVALVTDPSELMVVPGHHWLRDYDDPVLDAYPDGTLVVAPCTFNTLNKIALGIADNLAVSMICDGIGAGRRTLIAPALNRGLWHHPQTQVSIDRLRQAGCEMIMQATDDGGAPFVGVDAVIDAVDGIRTEAEA